MVKIKMEKLFRFAEFLKNFSSEIKMFNVISPDKFPKPNAKEALNYFFAVTMQDYGFWLGTDRYIRPIYGLTDNKILKGSDWLWTASKRIWIKRGPEFFNPKNLAKLSQRDIYEWFSDDHGPIMIDNINKRLIMVNKFGDFITRRSINLRNTLEKINKGKNPLKAFLNFTKRLPGYNTDPLLKKNTLLAIMLALRPEKFLKVDQKECVWPPMIDYHIMRLLLRMGIVDISGLDKDNKEKIKARKKLTEELEKQIRKASFEAVKKIVILSGKSMFWVDQFLWNAREFCPEIENPNCRKCALKKICEKNTELFQPVFKTTNY